VLLLAAALALLAGGALLFTHRFPARMPPLPIDPHARPLDFADHELRRALREYATFTLANGLSPIDECSGQRETYRVVFIPGLGDGRFVAVDIDVLGSTSRVQTWAFNARPQSDGYAWQVVSERIVDSDTLEAIRSDAARLLLSDLPAAIADAFIDASEEVVETCRNGRYHFYRRRNPGPADTPFNRFARNLLALSR